MDNVKGVPIQRGFKDKNGKEHEYTFYEPTIAHYRIANAIARQMGLDMTHAKDEIMAMCMACIQTLDGEDVRSGPERGMNRVWEAEGKPFRDVMPMFIDFSKWYYNEETKLGEG